MQNQTYAFNGAKVNFDLDKWLENSHSYTRDEMPQVDIEKFEEHFSMFSSYLKIDIEHIEAFRLLPTQSEINFSNVLMNVAKMQTLSDDKLVFLCSKDFHIVDGHHRLVQQLLVDNSRLVKCYIVDLDIHDLLLVVKAFDNILTDSKDIAGNIVTNESLKELIESFGVQGPEAVPGMGDVDMGTPTNAEEIGTKGSGDITGRFITRKELAEYGKKKTIDESDELVALAKGQTGGLITSSYLKSLAKMSNIDWGERLKALRLRRGEDPETGEILDPETGARTGRYAADEKDEDGKSWNEKYGTDIASIVHEAVLESMGDISPEEWSEMMQMQSIRNLDALKTIDSTNTLELNTVIEDAATDKNSSHLKLDKHFENADGLELLTCINKPVQRKCLQINEPFSCKTLEGITQGKKDDYLVQGIDGEIYPCDKDIFEKTYHITSELEETID